MIQDFEKNVEISFTSLFHCDIMFSLYGPLAQLVRASGS